MIGVIPFPFVASSIDESLDDVRDFLLASNNHFPLPNNESARSNKLT
jgi:hypothetical protein